MRNTTIAAACAAALLAAGAPARATTVKTDWVIRDARLRARVVRAVEEYLRFGMDDSAGARYVAARALTAEVDVEAIDIREENTRRLVAISIDSERIAPTDNVRMALGEILYTFVTARRGYAYDVSRTSREERLCNALWWPNEQIDARLDRQIVKLGATYAVIDEIGNPDVLMPWWNYGMVRIGVAHPNFRFMFQGPFTPGLQNLAFVKPRHIDGAFGGAFEFHVEGWSGELAYASMSKVTALDNTFIRPPHVDYVSMIAQVRYSITADAGSWGAVQVTFGGGLHKVQHDSIGAAPALLLYNASAASPLIVSPLFEVAFVSAHDDIELTGQFYHSALMFTAAARVAGPVWLAASAVLIKQLRDPDPWEPENFVFITPEIRL